MIEWLLDAHANPSIEVEGQELPINIHRNKRAKRLTMRLASEGNALKVTLPPWGRTKDVLDFAESRRSWIAKQLARQPEAQSIAPGAQISFNGKPLHIGWREDAPRKGMLIDDHLSIGGPQDNLETRLQKWLETQALQECSTDLEHYCQRAGEALPQLRLSRAKRRWGSCSSHSGKPACIRINWRLIMAPDHVRRSVVAHEVAHLKHFDHSPGFYAHLEGIFDSDLPAADLWLKQQGPSLYTSFL